jgi:hypothetical protein
MDPSFADVPLNLSVLIIGKTGRRLNGGSLGVSIEKTMVEAIYYPGQQKFLTAPLGRIEAEMN